MQGIGRLFMIGIPGTTLDSNSAALIRELDPSGVILFERNIETPEQLALLCNKLQKYALDCHGNPLFLAVDQEGGRVARLKAPFTVFPGNAAMAKDPTASMRAEDFARITAEEMRLVGLNMDFAPVLDVVQGIPERHLKNRTFGSNPEKTILLGNTIIRLLQENGIMATAKHFPGLGMATRDPHQQLPRIHTDAEQIKAVHLPPFSAAIKQGVACIMTSHALYPGLDPEYPASLSHKIMTDLLRETLGFQGLLITDDLEMGAIKKTWGVPDGAAASFQAGADILLICKDQYLVRQTIRTVREKVKQGMIPLQRVAQSLKRIDQAKSKFLKGYQAVRIADVRTYFSE